MTALPSVSLGVWSGALAADVDGAVSVESI